MDRSKPAHSSPKSAASLRDAALYEIPTTFGRLVYLTSLREPNTGQYLHYGWIQQTSEAETDALLRQLHVESFAAWILMSLEEKKADLELYLAGMSGSRASILATWANLRPYRNLVPMASTDAERQHFYSDLEILISLLRNVHGSGADE